MRTFSLVVILLSIISCSKIALEELPGITLVMNWDDSNPDIDIPNSFTFQIGDHKFLLDSNNNILNNLSFLGVGVHTAYVYTNTSNVIVEGHIARVSPLNTSQVNLKANTTWSNQQVDLLNPMPDIFFASKLIFENKNNTIPTINLKMKQEIQELHIILKPIGSKVDQIIQIDARLSGIAGSWDLESNLPLGPGMVVPLAFSKQDDGTWIAKVRLIGVVGDKQELQGALHFKDNSYGLLNFESDMTSDFVLFNKDKHIVLKLQAALKTPHEAKFTAELKDWIKVHDTSTAW